MGVRCSLLLLWGSSWDYWDLRPRSGRNTYYVASILEVPDTREVLGALSGIPGEPMDFELFQSLLDGAGDHRPEVRLTVDHYDTPLQVVRAEQVRDRLAPLLDDNDPSPLAAVVGYLRGMPPRAPLILFWR